MCLPGESVQTFPLGAFQIDQVPEEDRLAFKKIESVAGKPPPESQDHASAPPSETSMSAVMVYDAKRIKIGSHLHICFCPEGEF
jgi:hypothetical protein